MKVVFLEVAAVVAGRQFVVMTRCARDRVKVSVRQSRDSRTSELSEAHSGSCVLYPFNISGSRLLQ